MLSFKCPVCGGTVGAQLSTGERFASLDFRCSRCGIWVDVDMTAEFKEAKADAMDYYNGRKNGIERGKYHGQELLPDAR